MTYYCYCETDQGIVGMYTHDKFKVRRFKLAFWRWDTFVLTY